MSNERKVRNRSRCLMIAEISGMKVKTRENIFKRSNTCEHIKIPSYQLHHTFNYFFPLWFWRFVSHSFFVYCRHRTESELQPALFCKWSFACVYLKEMFWFCNFIIIFMTICQQTKRKSFVQRTTSTFLCHGSGFIELLSPRLKTVANKTDFHKNFVWFSTKTINYS